MTWSCDGEGEVTDGLKMPSGELSAVVAALALLTVHPPAVHACSTFKSSQVKSSQVKLSQARPSQAKPSQARPGQAKLFSQAKPD